MTGNTRILVIVLCGVLVMTLFLVFVLPRYRFGNFNVELQTALHSHLVDQIDIVAVSDGSVTEPPLTPDALERAYGKKVEIRRPAIALYEKEVERVVSFAGCRETSEPGEARLGVIFYAAGKRLKAFYYDNRDERSYIDGRFCKSDRSLYDWARRQLKF